ncbi:lipopolysaccharide core heptose(II) kinase RfaY, partial [Escherichia coli]
KVFIKDNDPFYEQVLNDFLTCRVKTLKVFRSLVNTKPFLFTPSVGLSVFKFSSQSNKSMQFF